MPDAITLRQADSLYQGFPDFSAWPAPTEDDLRLWDRFASHLEEARQKATPETLKKAIEVAVRAAAVDTGAIEGLYSVDYGFTMTVATQAFAWEQAIEEKGENVRVLFEAQLEAYDLVLDAATRRMPLSEAWIRTLHETVCAGQPTYKVLTDQGQQEQELPRGVYKTQPNHVLRFSDRSLHPYAPVDRVPAEMHRLLEQIRTPEFEAAHPIAQATYLHYGFVAIHPFADGNGRVARALASIFFYRALSIPFLVFAQLKNIYKTALHQTDLGTVQPLLTFFRDRGIDTIQLVIDHLLTAEAPAPETIVARIRLLDKVALRLLASAKEHIELQIKELDLPTYMELTIEPTYDFWDLQYADYRQAEDENGLSVFIDDHEHDLTKEMNIRVLISKDVSEPLPLLLEAENSDDTLEARFEDAHPVMSESLRLRLANWCRRLIGRMLEDMDLRKLQP